MEVATWAGGVSEPTEVDKVYVAVLSVTKKKLEAAGDVEGHI